MLNSKLSTLLLIAICTIMGSLIYFLITNPQEILNTNSIEQTEKLELEEIPVSQVEVLADISEFEEIIQRPLFSSSRRPAEEDVEETVKQETFQTPVRNPALKLAGIVLSNEENVALIKSRKNPKLSRVKLEETIDGWKLIEINPGSVKLESGRQQITLEMTRKADPTQSQNKTNLLPSKIKQQNPPANINKQSRSALQKIKGAKPSSANSEILLEEDEDEEELE